MTCRPASPRRHEELDAGLVVVDGVAVVPIASSDEAGTIGVVERSHGAAATLAAALDAVLEVLLSVAESILAAVESSDGGAVGAPRDKTRVVNC